MVGHGGSSAGSYLADPTSPIPSHCASIVVTSTVRVKLFFAHRLPFATLWFAHLSIFAQFDTDFPLSEATDRRRRVKYRVTPWAEEHKVSDLSGEMNTESRWWHAVAFELSLAFRRWLTLKVLVMTIDALGHFLNRIITAQWEGMGDVASARYEPALLPPCPTIWVLSYSNCRRSTHSISKWIFRNLAL